MSRTLREQLEGEFKKNFDRGKRPRVEFAPYPGGMTIPKKITAQLHECVFWPESLKFIPRV